MRDTLTLAEARRVALAAQGFEGTTKLRARRPFDPALERLHVLQIDSVNVFARSHYLPVFSRHGDYPAEALDRLLWQSGDYTEYWAHEAAFIAVNDRPLFAWRMDEYRERHIRDGFAQAHAKALSRVRSAFENDGPQFVRELEDGPRGSRGPWWDWSDTKLAVERLFAWGEVVSAGRERFERRYALEEHALPSSALVAPPTRADAQGTLIPVTVEGWTKPSGAPIPAWLHRDARVPTRLSPDALLTPFDPVCWFRPRAERLFGFHYRIEIYTPKEQRRFGYYCLPLMVGGRLVGRIDLKADRAGRALLVQAAWQEPGAPAHTNEVAQALLARAASWQGLDTVIVTGVGNLPLPARIER